MIGPLLESKYRVPSGRDGDVARPRLTERLDATSRHAVTLVSAPAGFGKTTILANWLAAALSDGPPVAWVSLDSRDNDPSSFWTYVPPRCGPPRPESATVRWRYCRCPALGRPLSRR